MTSLSEGPLRSGGGGGGGGAPGGQYRAQRCKWRKRLDDERKSETAAV